MSSADSECQPPLAYISKLFSNHKLKQLLKNEIALTSKTPIKKIIAAQNFKVELPRRLQTRTKTRDKKTEKKCSHSFENSVKKTRFQSIVFDGILNYLEIEEETTNSYF